MYQQSPQLDHWLPRKSQAKLIKKKSLSPSDPAQTILVQNQLTSHKKAQNLRQPLRLKELGGPHIPRRFKPMAPLVRRRTVRVARISLPTCLSLQILFKSPKFQVCVVLTQR